MTVELGFNKEPYAETFQREGYFIQEGVLPAGDVEHLRDVVSKLPDRDEVRRKRRIYGVRNMLEICPEARALAGRPEIRKFATAALGENAFAVRAIFFNKVPDANWSLFWHQDSVIAVKERHDVAGFLAWSQKSGVWQTQPPSEVLAKMVAVRIHLDDCFADNGPLRVIPGSHRFGWLDEEIDDWKQRVPEVVCEVGVGGVVAMCPLTLHASAESRSVCNRRVIHIEYAVDQLPSGLQWNNRV